MVATNQGIQNFYRICFLDNYFHGTSPFSKSYISSQIKTFLFTWLKKQNIDDAFIQPYSGHQKFLRVARRTPI